LKLVFRRKHTRGPPQQQQWGAIECAWEGLRSRMSLGGKPSNEGAQGPEMALALQATVSRWKTAVPPTFAPPRFPSRGGLGGKARKGAHDILWLVGVQLKANLG